MESSTPATEPASGDDIGSSSACQNNAIEWIKPIYAYEYFLKENRLRDSDKVQRVYQVYQDLLLIRKWTNIRVSVKNSCVYLAGSAASAFDSVFPGEQCNNMDRTQVIVPMSSWDEVRPTQLQRLCKTCVHPETGKELRCITLAIVDDDSTTAYYRIFNKWDEIVHPQWKMKKDRKTNEEKAGTEGKDREGAHESLSESCDSEFDS